MYTYSASPDYYYLCNSNWQSDKDDVVRNCDRRLHQSLDKIFRERYSSSSSSSQFKKFRCDPQHSTDWKSIIKLILEQEPALSKHFSKEEFEKLSLLWISILTGYEKSAELLLRSGADVNELFGRHDPQMLDEKWTVLHALLQMDPSPENERLIRLAVDYGADLKARDCEGRTVLHYAMKEGRVEMTKMLLEKGANIYIADDLGVTPLLMVVTSEKLMFIARTDRAIYNELVSLLIKPGADLNVRDCLGRTLLHHAVIKRQVQMTEMLLKKGADVNAADNEGWTPLLVALRNTDGKVDGLVPLLIKHGADVFAKSRNGENILHHLASLNPQEHAVELARVMIEKGVSLDDKAGANLQPIHQAAIFGKNKLVELFLDHGANVNALTTDGESPLYLAARSKNISVVEILLKRGANVNLKTNTGRTALHTACQLYTEQYNFLQSYGKVIELLLFAGADMLVENDEGIMPISYIVREEAGAKLIMRLLALKKACQPSIELQEERFIEDYPPLQNYYRNCMDEIDRMRFTRFIHTCTFFELFSKSYCQIAALMRNPDFETKFKQCDLSGFPTYDEDIRRAFDRAQKHYHAMLEQASVINEAVYNALPDLVVDKVVHHVFNCCKSLK